METNAKTRVIMIKYILQSFDYFTVITNVIIKPISFLSPQPLRSSSSELSETLSPRLWSSVCPK